MTPSEKLAIAAHLHVLLRRKTGRVTDTEWMALNHEYAAEIVRFARAKAIEDGHPDLSEWAGKLERAMGEPPTAVHRPLAAKAMDVVREHLHPPPPAPLDPSAPVSRLPEERASGFGHSTLGNSTYGESGFAESTLEPGKPRKPRDPNAPRYVGGIR
ncbi:MAG: hypothetical protein ABW051_05735 [Burkholderiaceae bacterium]